MAAAIIERSQRMRSKNCFGRRWSIEPHTIESDAGTDIRVHARHLFCSDRLDGQRIGALCRVIYVVQLDCTR